MERRNKDNRNIQKSDDNRKLLLTAKQQSGMKNVKYRSSWKEKTKRDLFKKKNFYFTEAQENIFYRISNFPSFFVGYPVKM